MKYPCVNNVYYTFHRETEVVIEGEKTVDSDIPVNEEETTDEKKETAAPEPEEKEPEVISCSSY